MTKVLGIILLVVNGLMISAIFSFGQKVWIEKNGYVIIEAEDVDTALFQLDRWKLEVSPEGYSGKGYIKWMGSSLVGHDKEKIEYNDMPTDRKIIYQIKINMPGKYYWRLRNIHKMEDGDNDAFVSVNKSSFGKTYDWNEDEFTWDETGNWASGVFVKGIINFEIAGRSQGFGIDRIVFFHESLALTESDWSIKGPYLWMDNCVWAKPPKVKVR